MSVMPKEEFIKLELITEEKERNFFVQLTSKQQEMYLVRKFVHQYKFTYGGTHKECLEALNQFCLLKGFKTRKSVKSVSNIALEPFMAKEFENDYYGGN